MTIKATVHVWWASVPPKQKLVLLFAANNGPGGIPVDELGLTRLAEFTNTSTKKARRAVDRLLKSGHLESADGQQQPSVRVKMPAGELDE